MKWNYVKFRELYELPSRNGITVKPEMKNGDIPIVNMHELFANLVSKDSNMRRISISDDQIKRFLLKKDDLLFARRSVVADGAGKCTIVNEVEFPTVFESSIIRVRLDKEKCHPSFYSFWFESPGGEDSISRIVTGTNVKGIRGSDLAQIKVPAPNLHVQRRIASILSAYDELIENNRKQIKLLEEAAQRLYREWFVDLRFPGYESTPINPDTDLPEGWKRTSIDDICDVFGGGTPSTANRDYWENGTIPWITPSDVTANQGFYLSSPTRYITELGLANSSAQLLPKNTVLMTSRATIGHLAICDYPACTNQGFISCILKQPDMVWWFLLELSNRTQEMKLKSKGSTFLELSKSTFRKMDIVLPEHNVLSIFQSVAGLLMQKAMLTKKSIVAAQEARDRLLPKLMSGEIEV